MTDQKRYNVLILCCKSQMKKNGAKRYCKKKINIQKLFKEDYFGKKNY